jgi:hypothetical protein
LWRKNATAEFGPKIDDYGTQTCTHTYICIKWAWYFSCHLSQCVEAHCFFKESFVGKTLI